MKKLIGFLTLAFLCLGANVSNIKKITGDGILIQSRDGSSTILSNNPSSYFSAANPEPGGSSPFQLLFAHKRIQRINPAGAITIKMPTTSIQPGDLWTIYNDSAQEVTIQSSGANQIDIINNGFIRLMAQVANPTGAADWKVLEVQEGQSVTATFSGGLTTSPSVTVKIKRINTWVHVAVPPTGGTCNGGSTINTAASVIPSRYRPQNDQPTVTIPIQNNGATQTVNGMGRIFTDGSINIFKDATGAAFTNAAGCQWFRDINFVYDPSSA